MVALGTEVPICWPPVHRPGFENSRAIVLASWAVHLAMGAPSLSRPYACFASSPVQSIGEIFPPHSDARSNELRTQCVLASATRCNWNGGTVTGSQPKFAQLPNGAEIDLVGAQLIERTLTGLAGRGAMDHHGLGQCF